MLGGKPGMSAPAGPLTRRPLAEVTKRYGQFARFYCVLEVLYLVLPRARRRAVVALDLKAGVTDSDEAGARRA